MIILFHMMIYGINALDGFLFSGSFFAKGGGLTIAERIEQTDEIFRGHGSSSSLFSLTNSL